MAVMPLVSPVKWRVKRALNKNTDIFCEEGFVFFKKILHTRKKNECFFIFFSFKRFSSLAQLVERLAVNQKVTGSTPVRGVF
jgi:hypothetical protein